MDMDINMKKDTGIRMYERIQQKLTVVGASREGAWSAFFYAQLADGGITECMSNITGAVLEVGKKDKWSSLRCLNYICLRNTEKVEFLVRGRLDKLIGDIENFG